MILSLLFAPEPFIEDEEDIYISPKYPLGFDDWFFLNSDSLEIEFAETGADREPCFDFEKECDKKYDFYLLQFEKDLQIRNKLNDESR